MKINKNSLQAKIKNLSSQKGVPSNVILYTSKFNTIEDFYQIAILEIGGIFLWK